jgi:hypothetical protein
MVLKVLDRRAIRDTRLGRARGDVTAAKARGAADAARARILDHQA